MRLNHSANQIGAAFQPAMRFAEHRVGLANTGCRAQIDAQLPAFLLIIRPLRNRLVGGCHILIIHPCDQLFTGYFWSSSRLS